MKLNLLKESIRTFYREGYDMARHRWKWIYDKQESCMDGWPGPEEVLRENFERALSSTQTQRLWKRHQHRPKELMLKLIDADPEYTFLAFKDLFDENKDIEMRLDRFTYYADELLVLARKKDSDLNEADHHQDARSISLYLSLRYPDKYCYYRQDMFRKVLSKLGSLKVPDEEDPVRFFKICRTILKFLKEDPSYQMKNADQLSSSGDLKESLWPVIEYAEWLTGIEATS